MDFKLAYERFCRNAAKRRNIPSEKLQDHHVCPHHFGGTRNDGNIVKLTPAEHVYAHVLLNLSLFQRGMVDKMLSLNYSGIPDYAQKYVFAQNALKRLKIAVFTSGKKHLPNVLSLKTAAKYFCFVTHRDFTDPISLNSVMAKTFSNALFGKAKYCIKTKLLLEK